MYCIDAMTQRRDAPSRFLDAGTLWSCYARDPHAFVPRSPEQLLHMTWDQHCIIVPIGHLPPLAIVRPLMARYSPLSQLSLFSKTCDGGLLFTLVAVLQLGSIGPACTYKRRMSRCTSQTASIAPHYKCTHPLNQSHTNGFLRYPLLYHRQHPRGWAHALHSYQCQWGWQSRLHRRLDAYIWPWQDICVAISP